MRRILDCATPPPESSALKYRTSWALARNPDQTPRASEIGDCAIESNDPRLLRVVTLASATGRYGGPYDTATRQAEIAAKLGLRTTLLAGVIEQDAPDAASLPDTIDHRFVAVRRLLPSPGFTSYLSVHAIRALWQEVGRADVVHVSVTREAIPISAMLIALSRSKALVSQPHGMLTSRSSILHRAIDLVLRPLLRRSSTVVALTDVERADLQTWMRKRHLPPIAVLGNPLPIGLEAATVGASPSRIALFVARLHPRKRVGDFVKAAEVALDRGWDEQYRVVGPDQGDLTEVTRSRSFGRNLVYDGPVPASLVPSIVAQCGVFVLPSENEPWGNVLATALALGRPTVVTQSTALAGVIERYAAGIVVPDAAPLELAAAIRTACAPPRSAALSEGARRLALEMLSADAQREELARLYRLQ